MSVSRITPVVLCGGSGTRLWPLSRAAYPKQLLPLFQGKSLLQQTLLRLRKLAPMNRPLIICNQAYRFIIAEQLRELDDKEAQIILEPEGRNTAPAVTVAAFELEKQQSEQLMLVLPVDHVIADEDGFIDAIEQGLPHARAGRLVTFGIQPSKAETAYGYIQKGESLAADVFQAKQFIEKPDLARAEMYFNSGEYFWNSGIFLFQVKTYLDEARLHAPDIVAVCERSVKEMRTDLDFHRLPAEVFALCRNESLDYAILEKSAKIVAVALASDWMDLGSWSALWELEKSTTSNNVLKGDVIVEQVSNSYVHAENRLLALIGVSDLIVVETSDAVMVAHKDKCQDVKRLVARLKDDQRPEVERHRREYRPWGYYDLLNEDPNFHAKRLVVKPGAKLSLQLHQHRSEHWVVIQGSARVTCGEKVFDLNENQSTFTPRQSSTPSAKASLKRCSKTT